jgi:hypothetical protein
VGSPSVRIAHVIVCVSTAAAEEHLGDALFGTADLLAHVGRDADDGRPLVAGPEPEALPIGSSFGHSFCAADRFSSTAFAPGPPSASVKSRPFSSGIPMAPR